MKEFDTSRAAELVRLARTDAQLTQAQLAQRTGMRQPSLAQIELGTRKVSSEMLERILRAANYRPSLPVAEHAQEIKAAAQKYGQSNVRVFGSMVRGQDDFNSDIDLLVTPSPETDLFHLALFARDVQRLTGFPADVVADTSVIPTMREIQAEAVAL
ncbi:XRE family transcriptional regulator [Kocuria sp.]|uniref:XRE family transcriptional regulator n=1 Tax=Kocuria sp. TaxID=1871328 RepID=UPI0026DF3604|nr:XRE family transcriptional regulator [Kocuria sp.]MDO5618097.1 helix-turn-helix domain-containing protein [Kocuria sp.]